MFLNNISKMENQEENKQVPAKKDSQELSLSTLTLTPEGTITGVAKLKTVYPTLTEGFFDVLIERVKFYKFSDWEFSKAINHIIDTNKYPPQISDFISYMRPDGVADIPDRDPKPEPIRPEDVPANDEDLSFLDKYAPDYEEKHKIKLPPGFEDFEACGGK